MAPIISVVVPIYNVEQYLEKCVKSIQNQTLSNIEIILVDDGSTDESGVIAENLALNDERIRVYHKENGGLSSARNYGIDRATASLIGFIDSDDYIEADMYELLYNNLLKENADISMCSLYDVYPGLDLKKNREPKYLVLNNEQAIKIVLEAKLTSVTAVNKLYKKILFKNVRYPIGKIAEDAFVIVRLLQQCAKIVLTTEQKYYYIHRENSITTAQFRMKDCDVIEAYKLNYDIVKKNFPSLEKEAKMRICWSNFYVLDKLMVSKSDMYHSVLRDVVSCLRNNFLFIIFSKNFHLSRKIAMVLLMIHVNLYKIASKIHHQRLGVGK